MDLINSFVQYCIDLLSSGGLILGFFLVFIECFIPALPLSVFVAFNVSAFGFFIGILISWIATSCGSYICYFIFKKFKEKVVNILPKKKFINKIDSGIYKFKVIKLPHLVMLITLPFTPSFLINILSGLSEMSNEKFITSILIGKLFTILFWGYIGKSFIDSLTDINSLIFILIALILAYIISKIVSKKMNIE